MIQNYIVLFPVSTKCDTFLISVLSDTVSWWHFSQCSCFLIKLICIAGGRVCHFCPICKYDRDNDACRVKITRESQSSISCRNASSVAWISNATCHHLPVGSQWGIMSFKVHKKHCALCQAAYVEVGPEGGGGSIYISVICVWYAFQMRLHSVTRSSCWLLVSKEPPLQL